jgi:L-ascorbate metabolism protein UlaG (beta-lactamase superfamily)
VTTTGPATAAHDAPVSTGDAAPGSPGTPRTTPALATAPADFRSAAGAPTHRRSLDAAARARGLRRERVHASPRFDGRRFRNTRPVGPGLRSGSAGPLLREWLTGAGPRVPAAPLPVVRPLDAWSRAPETGLRATWLGHSTVLVEIDGARVLTDPVWSERVSPVSFVGPRRFHPVPASLEELPALDVVLLSHDHYDHLDRATVARLARLDVPFVTSLGVGAHLEAYGVRHDRVVELDWWEHVDVGPLRITAAPSQHFSGRGVGDRDATAWSSFHVRGPRHAFFFSGDTGLTPEYADIAARLGPVDLVMLEVGAFHPAWADIHLGPHNALEALALVSGGRLRDTVFLPVHWGTFRLALHPWDEPAEVLAREAPARGVHLALPRIGAAFEPSRTPPFEADRGDAWWRLPGGAAP